MRPSTFPAALFALAACADHLGPQALGTSCANPGAVQDLGQAPAELTEGSGLAASRAHPGVLYTHNDSGDQARVFAIDDHGTLLATLLVSGASNEDWEDIAIGPCPSGSCIYVGDIGDNDKERSAKIVYRFPEPESLDQASITVSGVEALPFRYPDGEPLHDAETLLVHPTTGDIFIVTKEERVPSVVFAFPQPLVADAVAKLTKVATLSVPGPTEPDVSSGAIDPSGSAVLLRLGSARVVMLEAPVGESFEAAFRASPQTLPDAAEQNGEGISWNADGTGYYMIGEGAAHLRYVACE